MFISRKLAIDISHLAPVHCKSTTLKPWRISASCCWIALVCVGQPLVIALFGSCPPLHYGIAPSSVLLSSIFDLAHIHVDTCTTCTLHNYCIPEHHRYTGVGAIWRPPLKWGPCPYITSNMGTPHVPVSLAIWGTWYMYNYTKVPPTKYIRLYPPVSDLHTGLPYPCSCPCPYPRIQSTKSPSTCMLGGKHEYKWRESLTGKVVVHNKRGWSIHKSSYKSAAGYFAYCTQVGTPGCLLKFIVYSWCTLFMYTLYNHNKFNQLRIYIPVFKAVAWKS